ncbi:phage head closure protein [Pseudomonas sp. KSR10]|uniref:phage head closure protein n=1 Tax=Pseudomonas sp. KSR10 TaxID=2916654 RepID=UPI001EF8C985|nr:phage head closure protein [Pseudomonas sp. KSR10]MCG6541745.1 phage head closure protein [Pseudomonas sp. KSR10]
MRAGALRRRCSLQVEQRTGDGIGGYVSVWVELRKVWAEVTTPSGRVSNVAQQLAAVVTAEVRVRPSEDFIAGRRLVKGGMVYRIEAVLPSNKGDQMQLLCSSVANP